MVETWRGDSGNDYKEAHKTRSWALGRKKWESWVMYGELGDDTLIGGAKDDTLYGNGSDIDAVVSHDPCLGEGNDLLQGKAGNDMLFGGSGRDRLYGDQDNDTLYGESGCDSLHGGTGSDVLDGGYNDDVLNGYGYSDGSSLREYDVLTGGEGADTFVLGDRTYVPSGTVYYKGSGYATITDFDWREGDKFQVTGNQSDYSLIFSNWVGSSAQDTLIRHNGDVIAVVQDTTDVIIGWDFDFV